MRYPLQLRQRLIAAALEALAARAPAGPLRAVEVGCMFNPNEGRSTWEIAAALQRLRPGSKLMSIEYDASHVAWAEAMLRREAPELLEHVAFRIGHSLEELPAAIDASGTLDFALLDGGAHPEVCLEEFEVAVRRLAPEGLILIDDLQTIAPSSAYTAARPFGKATLTLPFLVIADYLARRDEFLDANCEFYAGSGMPRAAWIQSPADAGLAQIGKALRYAWLCHRTHQMLVVGAPGVLAALLASLRSQPGPGWLARGWGRLAGAAKLLLRGDPGEQLRVVSSLSNEPAVRGSACERSASGRE